MIKKIFFSLTLLLLTNNCGFKVVKQSDIANFNIAEITTEAKKELIMDLKINFHLTQLKTINN